MAVRVLFVVGTGIGAIDSATLLAQTFRVHGEPEHPRDIPPELYREPVLTYTDVSLEWYAYRWLVVFVLSEDEIPGMGLDLTTQKYGLTRSEAATLL